MTEQEERESILEFYDEAVAAGARKGEVSECLDVSLRTINRWIAAPEGDRRPGCKKSPNHSLKDWEEEQIISICCSKRFRNLPPAAIVPILAEEGVYIASEATMYRILKKKRLLKHRAESKPARKNMKPRELKATGSNQVLSWDITYMQTNVRGRFYYLYLFEDVWSRLITAWEVHEYESGEVASNIMKKCSEHQFLEGVHLHSDNGSPMKSATMLATLQHLGVIPSHSRPNVSDDNPYIESLFRTLKCNVGYPRRFESLDHAREWVGKFVYWYNNEHRHSKIKWVTPMQRHTGQDKEILQKRKETYEKARQKNPARWSGEIRNWDPIETVYLNPSRKNNIQKKAA